MTEESRAERFVDWLERTPLFVRYLMLLGIVMVGGGLYGLLFGA